MKRLVLFLALFTYAFLAQAYIDPGIGSTIFQALIAGIIGGLYVIKIYWFKIVSIFSRLKRFIKK